MESLEAASVTSEARLLESEAETAHLKRQLDVAKQQLVSLFVASDEGENREV